MDTGMVPAEVEAEKRCETLPLVARARCLYYTPPLPLAYIPQGKGCTTPA